VSLDFDVAERDLARFQQADPDACFDAEWARHLLAAAVDALEALCKAQGKEAYFHAFRGYVLEPHTGDADAPSYASVAGALDLRVTDVTNYLAWTRREFRRLVLEELREITANDDEYAAEARTLLGVEP
jgi:hypothetical protein